MKFQCPACETSYNLPAERFTKPVVKAVCKKCDSTLVIHKDTGKVEIASPSPGLTPKPSEKEIPTPTTIPPSLTVKIGGRSGRNYPAIIAVVAVLGLAALAGYYFVSKSGMDLFTIFRVSVSEEVKGSHRFNIARVYVRKDKKLMAAVGKIKGLSLLNDEVINWKGKEMAEVTLQVQGSKGQKRLQVILLKEDGQWRAVAAGEEPKVAKARKQPEIRKKPSAKSSLSRPGRKSQRFTLPAISTNKELANYLSTMPDLKILSLSRCGKLTDLSPLASLSQLTDLNLDRCKRIADISPLVKLKGLKQLNLHGCESLQDLTPLTRLSSLRVLYLPPTTTNEKLAQVLSHLPQLEKLMLTHCPLITDLSPLAGMVNLNDLEGTYFPDLVDITPLAGLTRLRVLDLRNSGVKDLKPLANLTNLERLYLTNSRHVNDISPLQNLTNLSILSLDGCKGVRDITALGKLTKLRILSLKNLEEINDISVLSNLTQLRNLYLQKCKKISFKQIRELRRALPRCSIERRLINADRPV